MLLNVVLLGEERGLDSIPVAEGGELGRLVQQLNTFNTIKVLSSKFNESRDWAHPINSGELEASQFLFLNLKVNHHKSMKPLSMS